MPNGWLPKVLEDRIQHLGKVLKPLQIDQENFPILLFIIKLAIYRIFLLVALMPLVCFRQIVLQIPIAGRFV